MNQQIPDSRDRDFTSKFPKRVSSSSGSKNGNLIEPFFETKI